MCGRGLRAQQAIWSGHDVHVLAFPVIKKQKTSNAPRYHHQYSSGSLGPLKVQLSSSSKNT